MAVTASLLSLLPQLVSDGLARLAYARPWVLAHNSVRGIVRVTSRAMRLLSVAYPHASSPHHVLGLSHRLKVSRVDAPSIPTDVVDDESGRYWAVDEPVSHPVGATVFCNAQLEMPVAKPVNRGGPKQAVSRLFHLRPETLFNLLPKLGPQINKRIAVATPAEVVRFAQPAGLGSAWLNAIGNIAGRGCLHGGSVTHLRRVLPSL